MRSRVSVCGLLPLLAALTASAQVAAQESPSSAGEPVDESSVPPDESASDTAAEGDAPAADEAAAMEASEPSYDDSGDGDGGGYSDSAPETDVVVAAEVDSDDVAPNLSVAAEFGSFVASGDAGTRVTLSPIVGLNLGVSDTIEVGVNWGMLYHSNGLTGSMQLGDSTSSLRVGNPQLSIARRSRSKDTHMTFGGGITLPFASLPNPSAPAVCQTDPTGVACTEWQSDTAAKQWIAADAYGHASAIRGDWNQWLWAPDQAAGVLNFEAHSVMEEVLVGGEVAMALLVPMEGEGDAAFAGQAAGEVGYATESVRVVMRAQLVATVTPSVDDVVQFSIDPYVAWDISESVTLTGRTTVNIDNPTGFDGSRIWGLRLGANIAL